MVKSKWLQIFVIAIACFIVYAKSLNNGFIWDDDQYVHKNHWISESEGPKVFWLTREMPQYYPMVFTTFWLEHKAWGLNAKGYHSVNLLFHILNAVFLFFLVHKLYPRIAFFVALLFAVHPIQAETVAWITERKNVLSLFFLLSSALAYVRFDQKKNTVNYLQSIVFFVLALLSKSIAAFFACVPIIYKWWKDGRLAWREVIISIPFFGVGLVAGLNTAYLEVHKVGALGMEWDFTFLERIVLMGRTLFFYIYKLCVPLEFMFFYPRWTINIYEIGQWVFVSIIAGIPIIFFLARKKIGRGAVTLFILYILSMLPASGILNVYPMQYSFVADHFSYLSVPILLILICSAGVFLLDRINNSKYFSRKGKMKNYVTGAGIAMVIYLGIKTMLLTGDYKDERTLWENLLKKNPTAGIACNNLGNIYALENKNKEAMELFLQAMRLEPRNAKAYTNMGNAYYMKGNAKDALYYYQQAAVIDPSFYETYNNIASAYAVLGENGKAVLYYKKALSLNPQFPWSHNNLGRIYQRMGKYDEAIASYKKAIEFTPWFQQAYVNLAKLYSALGMQAEAMVLYQKLQTQ
ncbi:Tetratricopeptide TPR_2 repeat protein [Candidatus Omnitrophus magneticus]|uniref:Tetratricopeptide TPR_2 repeat protein n=1 Tax=Candidatus Omnitrophus magneticus TaxID=1609969 RepID=A0A0F0CM35_9BACT|nr:Tetratricopeptide TPR_2 repeat protein [Candidatus Omnitrophus magneticus]